MMRFFAICSFMALMHLAGAQTTDAQGRKQGYWKKKDERSGKLVYEGQFKDNIPTGKFIYYYPNDSVQAIFYFRNEGKLSFAKLFHPNGKKMGEGKYVNELKGNNIDRIKDSVWTYYDEAGVLISKDAYQLGKKHGKSLVFLPEGGVAEERNFRNGVEDGPFKQYFDGKKVKGEGNYVNGKLEGKVVYYYPNGVEAAAGYYKNGCKNGPWIYKKNNGSISERELYKNCQPASQKETEAFFNKGKPGSAAPSEKEQRQEPKKGS